MKDKIEQILKDSKEWIDEGEENHYVVNTDKASKELYNLFIEEQIKLLKEIEMPNGDMLGNKIKLKIEELQKLKQ